ncbi:MAG: EutN/CcmL family microcompartment protein, partial [Bacteroidota bacterium]
MKLGRVIGSVWATQKDASLHGRRMLLVQYLHADGTAAGRPEAALDTGDAGPGDTVLVVTSAEAALPF